MPKKRSPLPSLPIGDTRIFLGTYPLSPVPAIGCYWGTATPFDPLGTLGGHLSNKHSLAYPGNNWTRINCDTYLFDGSRSLTFQGTWMDRDHEPIPVHGKTLVAWSCESWFTMATKLLFPDHSIQARQGIAAITMQYRGRLGDQAQKYSFVLKHSQLGQVEGEGWIGPESIVQRFWVLGDRDRRSGFETIHRIADDCYRLSSGMMSDHYLVNTLEATLTRHSH